MLVLTRKQGESIMIGDTVEITVLGNSSGNTRLGINAPREISVHRREIYQKIKKGAAQKRPESQKASQKDDYFEDLQEDEEDEEDELDDQIK